MIIINHTYSILVLILVLKYSTEQIFLKGKQLTKLKFLKQSDYTTTCYVTTLSDASTYRQSAIQSISQLVSWSVTESIRSISELISHLFSQLDNQSGRQPVTQMVSQLIVQPVNQSVSHLPSQSFSWFKSVISQSVFQSASWSVSQSLIQSIIQSVSQNQSVSQTVYQKVSKSMSQQSVLEYSDSQLVLHSQSLSNSKFIHFKSLKIILFVLIRFLCDYHLFNLELNLRQGEEVLIIGIKSGGLWLPVSKIVLLKVLLPWLYTVKITDSQLGFKAYLPGNVVNCC